MLIRGRIAQSLTLGAYSAQQAPGNAAYVLITQQPGWATMRWLCPMPNDEVLQHLLRSTSREII